MGALSGRVAIVTGAGKGLGRAYALELASQGAAVVVNNRRHAGDDDAQASASQTAAAIRARGGRATANFDAVQSADAGRHMVELALREFGRLDIVVANAAVPQAAPFHRLGPGEFRGIFDVGFFGTLHLLEAAWPLFREQRYGRIVTTSSSAGRYGQHGLSAYGAAKAAIESLSRTLAAEGLRHDIRVNVVSPYAHSQMTEAHIGGDVAALFQAERVAPLVAWLASEQCSANGEVFVAGGGRCRRAYAVETGSVPMEPGDFGALLRALQETPAVGYAASNAAFDSLVREAGLMPQRAG